MFPGQGAQWAGMAVELLDSAPVFAQRMKECADALAPHIDWSLLDVLRGVDGAPSLERVDVVQPVLFAMMISLAALWESFGIHPDGVVGHSGMKSPPPASPESSPSRTPHASPPCAVS